ncbi:hypothetical protein [Flavobacterium sp. HJ-32-4]|uniref:tetratricopeptide repeat protein n=2 Tax=unclassified Flavobacterium TaxID=196869 RepID=UPI001F13BD06|nr:hypothetical protein [Flavobacterium sp. HJ-32-4]UMY65878.1 hypothetical protein MKO97_00440 [Flavobacterium sp. HJ-32-4]
MRKHIVLSITFLAAATALQAQDLDAAKKAIDAEQYAKAKGILKSLTASKPDEGKNYFILGNLYLTEKVEDSATWAYQKGLTAKINAHFNNIGLGQIALQDGNNGDAEGKFALALTNTKKKDYEELLYIGRAYLNPEKPNYKKAIEFLTKAKTVAPNNAQVLLSLGDAYYGDKNVNEAYSAYRNAYDADNTVLRAKIQLGVITKYSKAFAEAKAEFEKVLTANPNYGPAYRELAETYYLWALNDKAKYADYNKTAISYYEKYMSLTDYSLASRMRHADFLILTKDYKALEAEANAMEKLDKVNPRILRYLGYAAYENGNIDRAISALNSFLSKSNAKIIGRDYLYLGFAKAMKALTVTKDAEGKQSGTVDAALFADAITNIRKGVELDATMANELNEFGKKFFDLKLYKEAAAIYEIAVSIPNTRNNLYDNFYLGYSLYFENARLEPSKVDVAAVQKANTAFDNVIKASPTTQDAYIYKARLNSLLQSDAVAQQEMVKYYQEYIRVVTEKGEAELAKEANKKKFVEAYDNIGIFYFDTDKAKAKENFQKALAINPEDETAKQYMAKIK